LISNIPSIFPRQFFCDAAIPTFKVLLTKRKLIHRLEKLENKKFKTTSTGKIIKFRSK